MDTILKDAAVYVGTYAKYNEGSLNGKWLKVSDFADKDEFISKCKSIHNDEREPEPMFQDWENIPSGFISESWISENVFELLNEINNLTDCEQEAFFAWIENYGYDIESEVPYDLLSKFKDAYVGQYDSEEDFACKIIEECYELPEFAKTYFDYNAFARDLFISDYIYIDGYVFSRN